MFRMGQEIFFPPSPARASIESRKARPLSWPGVIEGGHARAEFPLVHFFQKPHDKAQAAPLVGAIAGPGLFPKLAYPEKC